MAFNDEVLKDGRGRCIRIDGSLDKFSTITYRWGDVAGVLDGTNQYSNRILSVAPVRRGLGQNRVAGGGTCELVLANADGALDALAGRESMSTQAKLRLRIYVCLYTPGATPSFTSKLLGEFSLTDWVRQNNETLTLSLGDDVMGAVAQQAALPTFNDWHAVGGSAATNPLYDAYALPDSETQYTPIQLAFGEDWVLAHPHVLPHGTVDAAYQYKVIVPVCCTTDTGAVDPAEITNVRVAWMNWDTQQQQFIDLPPTTTIFVGSTPTTVTVWSIKRSPTITKDGKTFKIIYLVVRADLGASNLLANYITGNKAVLSGFHPVPKFEGLGNYGVAGVEAQRLSTGMEAAQYAYFGAGVLAWYVKGVPLSARTQTTSPIQHPVDVLTDLVDYYSNNTGITVNTTERERVRVATASAACAGVVQPWTSGPKRGDPVFQQPPSLRQVITAICQSSDIDCFIDWSGQFSFAADFWDFTIATSGSASWSPDGGTVTSGNGVTTQYIPTVIPETWLAGGVERWIPGDGERWAPFNRLWFNGGKANPADGQDPPFQGPWDIDGGTAAVTLSDRIIEATLEQGWRPFRQQAQTPMFWRQINVAARDVVRFRTHIGGLQLELGQYFALSWTRGTTLAGPYSGTIFQCEAITYAPGDDTVEVTAVWRNDVMTERQYILDDETYLTFEDIVITGTCDPAGAATVNFGATVNLTNLITGTILVLRDTTQAADVFTRNGAWLITAINIATPGAHFVTVAANGEGNFPAAGSVASGQWKIQYGATLNATLAATYPVNYPLGADRYGKATDSAGEYSNAETGNRLISG